MTRPTSAELLRGHLSTIPRQKWEELLSSIPGVFREAESVAPCVEGDSETSPADDYSQGLSKFVALCYEMGLVIDFDWMHWKEGATYLKDNSKKVVEADLETVVKLITSHIRNDRFDEDWLEDLLDNGHLTALLRRLREFLRL